MDDRNGEQELPTSGRVRARIQVGDDRGDDHYGDDHGGYDLILVANNNN